MDRTQGNMSSLLNSSQMDSRGHSQLSGHWIGQILPGTSFVESLTNEVGILVIKLAVLYGEDMLPWVLFMMFMSKV
jgi:hypothetical protein